MLTTAVHPTLSGTINPFHTLTSNYLNTHFNIILPSTPRTPKRPLPFGFPTKIFVSISPCVFYVPGICHFWSDELQGHLVWPATVHVMKIVATSCTCRPSPPRQETHLAWLGTQQATALRLGVCMTGWTPHHADSPPPRQADPSHEAKARFTVALTSKLAVQPAPHFKTKVYSTNLKLSKLNQEVGKHDLGLSAFGNVTWEADVQDMKSLYWWS